MPVKMTAEEKKAAARLRRTEQIERREQWPHARLTEADYSAGISLGSDSPFTLAVWIMVDKGDRREEYITIRNPVELASFIRALSRRLNALVAEVNEDVNAINLGFAQKVTEEKP